MENLLKNGTKMNFSQYKTYGEIDAVLRNIFTNNPYYWNDSPLYLDSRGELNVVIKEMIAGRVAVYEHTFEFMEPNDSNQAEVSLYNYCFGISRVRTNTLLPLVYYNAMLYMDKLGFSMCRTDNTCKIMRVQKNRFNSILDIIEQNGRYFDIDYFLRRSDDFDEIDESIMCECGTVEAYRVEAGIFYGSDGYVIFPFPTDDETIGRMYYFEKAI